MSEVDGDLIFAVLDEHLNNGCIDSRCWYRAFPLDDIEEAFPESFLEHLTEQVIEAINE